MLKKSRATTLLFLWAFVAFSMVNFTLLETIGLRVPNRNFRDFSLFNVDFKSRNSAFARYASAVNAIEI
jgi:hypothetical protein